MECRAFQSPFARHPRRRSKYDMNLEGAMSKILIVEDEQSQRDLYSIELQDDGYEIDQATNGKEAVDKVVNNKYDLVILDIRMPEMDGIEALGKILSRDKKIPIIIYTAYSNYKSNFMTWTADAYITKSSNLNELKDKVREILSARSK
jgi:two-component system response regulator (stage 0 sporulation protein F)